MKEEEEWLVEKEFGICGKRIYLLLIFYESKRYLRWFFVSDLVLFGDYLFFRYIYL